MAAGRQREREEKTAGDRLRIHKPAFPLSQYVEFMWRVSRSTTLPSRQRVYPDGAMALVIHLKRPTATYFVDDEPHTIRVPLLAGPYSRSFHFDPSAAAEVLGILFRPGVAGMFFPVAADELHNADIALCDLYPGEADALLNEICSATRESGEFLAVERYLYRKLRNAAPIHPAIRYAVGRILREGAVHSVRTIQQETGLSHTRFIQLFREHVGLTPKLFCRVRRFHALQGRIEKGMPVNWARLAADCGYFDQAHLIRDFRAFAGLTPLEYSREISDADRRLLAATSAG
ncbi:MAG TPA: helix-turn-helix domain-containing protein [Acidobacteriaceae bacterium]|jgi:AraC-like DNA-binding protein|nr:helix-turn-helix domain-containing protein [Acidobacteriaceae bacterium]